MTVDRMTIRAYGKSSLKKNPQFKSTTLLNIILKKQNSRMKIFRKCKAGDWFIGCSRRHEAAHKNRG